MNFVDAKNYRKQIKKLYKSAFPRNERAPLSFLFHRTGNGRDSFYAVVDDDEFIGLVYTIGIEKLVYVFFLAVLEDKRGLGYGSKILQQVRNMYPDSVITLAIEDTSYTSADNYDQRIKRLKFYEANGYKQLNIKINEAGVDYELLGTKASITQAEFLELMKSYFGRMLFKIIYKNTKFEK